MALPTCHLSHPRDVEADYDCHVHFLPSILCVWVVPSVPKSCMLNSISIGSNLRQ